MKLGKMATPNMKKPNSHTTDVKMKEIMMMVAVIATHNLSYHAVEGFNLSKNSSVLLTGPVESKFGYSVALWSDKEAIQRLVIGAPRGKEHPNLKVDGYELGNIFLCDLKGECHPHKRLPSLTQYNNSQQALEFGIAMKKYGMGFGEVLSSLKQKNSPLAACAPRFPWRRNDTLQVRGACYILQDETTDPTIIVPNIRIGLPLKTFQNAMMGFSAALIDDHTPSLAIGGPMAFKAEGMVANIPIDRQSRGTLTRISNTDPVNATLTDKWEGWQVAQGKFDGKETSIVVSAVNFINRGMIKFYPKEIKLMEQEQKNTLKEIHGVDVGAKFGYSLGVGDFNGDGVDDLLVGSPWSPVQKSRHLRDVGKVFVYYSPLLKDDGSQVISDDDSQVISGSEEWGKFGLSAAGLGDINRDGYDDAAMAAPYAGPEGQGIVYIYNGSPRGIIPKANQILHASEFSSGMYGFGFSLDGGIDMDNNGYPDVLIGAVESSKAVFLRSAPVVTLVGSANFKTEAVKVDNKGCNLEKPGYKNVKGVCFYLDIDIRYKSPTLQGGLNMELRMILQDQDDPPQFVFKLTNSPEYNQTVNIRSVNESTIKSGIVIFAKSDRSVIGKPVKVSVSAHLVPTAEPIDDVELPPVPPVLDVLSKTSFTTSVVLTCDNNQTCFSKPDMSISATSTELVVGNGSLAVPVILEVRNDPVYEVEITVNHPSAIKYQRVEGDKLIPECYYHKLIGIASYTKFTCRFKFIEPNEKVYFTLFFEQTPMALMQHLERSSDEYITIKLEVHSDSKDTDLRDNMYDTQVRIKTKAILYPNGKSQPENMAVKTNESLTIEEITKVFPPHNVSFPVQHLGPRITQYFSLNNRGPSPVKGAKLILQLPLFQGDQRVLYISEKPKTSPSVTCNWPTINPWALQTLDSGSNSTKSTQGTTTRKRRQIEKDQTSVLRDSTKHKNASIAPSDMYLGPTQDPLNRTEYVAPRDDSPPPRNARSFGAPRGTRYLDCLSDKCQVICNVSLLKFGEIAWVSFSGHLVMASLDKYGYKKIGVRSWISVEVNQKESTIINQKLAATTLVTVLKPPESGLSAVPFWLLLLAVMGSILFILVIMAVLWKTGFFKRNRPQTDAKNKSLVDSD